LTNGRESPETAGGGAGGEDDETVIGAVVQAATSPDSNANVAAGKDRTIRNSRP
jgi:hypothetical protein